MLTRQSASRPLVPSLAGLMQGLEPYWRPAVAFLMWWKAELAGCVPPRLRGAFSRPGQVVELVIVNGGATFQWRRGAQTQELARIGLARNEEAAAKRALGELRQRIRPRRTRIWLGLAPSQVLRRTLELPVAVVENLREVLELELDRHTPFKPEDVYFDHRIAGFDDGGKRVVVELGVVPRRLVERSLAIARALGFPPERVGVAGEDGMDFLRAGGESDAEMPRQTLIGRLAVTVGLTLLILLPWFALRQTLTREEARLVELKEQATATDALRTEVQGLLKRNRQLIERKQQGARVVTVMEELTRLLPDGTWVAELRIQDGKISLVGYSGSASALIGLIEASDLFSEAQFASPVLPDPVIGAERFHLVAGIAEG